MGFRFTRAGIEYSGRGSDMFAGVVRARFRLSEQGQTIVDVLTKVLGASVLLCDAETRTYHLAMPGDHWISHRSSRPALPRRCRVQARINDRWMLLVGSPRPLHPDADAIVKWAADKLAVHLPRRTADEPDYPPAAGGGGSGGSAEIGIPISWARKARN